MNWTVLLTYADGSSEVMYYLTRQEARNGARFYRLNWLADGPKIGKPLASVKIGRS